MIWARKVAADTSGAAAVLIVFSMSMIIGVAALAIDLGAVFLQTRQLQGITDLAALAAARDLDHAQTAAEATARANGWEAPLTVDLVMGTYAADKGVASHKRFVANASPADAVRVSILTEANLYFGQAILGKRTIPIRRVATAAQANLASFSIGSRLASLNGGAANALLTGLTGSKVSLAVMDYNALASADVDLLRYARALAVRANIEGLSFDEVLKTQIGAGDALTVLADMLTADGRDPAAAALRKIATATGNATPAQFDALIDLGPYGTQDHVAGGTGAGIKVNALALSNAMLLLAQEGRQIKLDLGATIPGLADVAVWLAVGERPNDSPWMTVAKDGSSIIRTAQTRLYVDAKVAPGGVLSTLGVAKVELPLVVELAAAQAKLSSTDCAASAATLSVAPGVGSLSIGQVDTTKLNDFKHALDIQPAPLITALIVKATGSANVSVGGAKWQTVKFTADDISTGATKTVATQDVAEASVGSLLSDLKLTVSVGGLALILGQSAVIAALKPILQAAAAPLDGLLNGLEDLLGVHVGEADVRVNGLRCRNAALVA